MKNRTDYQLVLFDMDGTLYFQQKLRLKMAFLLLEHALSRRDGLRELQTVLRFRRRKENAVRAEGLDESLCLLMDRESGQKEGYSFGVIRRWIHLEPLSYLAGCRDSRLLAFLRELAVAGTAVCVYSDYPTAQKQAALGIADIPGFYSGQPEIGRAKPDPQGILYIMSRFGIQDKTRVLLIGDRRKKDGLAAKNAGICYFHVRKHRLTRRLQKFPQP